MFILQKNNLRSCFITLAHYVQPKYKSTVAWPESLPEIKLDGIQVPTEFSTHTEALLKYTNDMHAIFFNYSFNVFRQLERAHMMSENEHQNKLKCITAELLKATNRFNVRGSIEYIREHIRKHHKAVKGKDLFEQLLDEDADFLKQFNEAALGNKLVWKDVRHSLVNLYHNFSKYAHGTNTTDNITIDSTLLAPTEQFVLGVLFTRYNVPFKYINKEGQFAEFPYTMKSISHGD